MIFETFTEPNERSVRDYAKSLSMQIDVPRLKSDTPAPTVSGITTIFAANS